MNQAGFLARGGQGIPASARPSFFATLPNNDGKLRKHGWLPGEVEVNVEEVAAVRQLWKSSAVVKQAITMVSDTLIKDGVIITINGNNVKVSPKVTRYLQKVFVPIVIEGLPWIMQTGLLPIGFRRKQRTTRVNPLADLVEELMREEEEKRRSRRRRKGGSDKTKNLEKGDTNDSSNNTSGESVRTPGGGGSSAPYRYEDSDSEDDDNDIDPDEELFSDVDETWESVRMLEYALGNTTPDVMPYVPEYGTGTITKLTRRSETFYRWHWLNTSIRGNVADEPEWDPEVQVYQVAGYGVDGDGSLNSILRTLLRKFMRLEQLWECTLKANMVGCDPVTLTRYTGDEAKKNAPPDDRKDEECDPNKEGGGFLWFGPLDKTENREERKKYLSKQEQELVWAQKKVYDSRAAQNVVLGVRDPATRWRLLNTVENHLPLPIHRVLERQQPPHLSTDVIEADNEFKKEAFMIIGVPQSAAMESGVSVRGNYEAMAATMRNTVIKWKRTFRDILTDVYLRMTMGRFSEKLIEFETKKRARDNGGDEDEAVKSVMRDLPKLADSSKVTVELAVAPEMTLSTLEYLYLNGMITYDKYAELSLLMSNLNHSDRRPGGDPFTKDERKSMLIKTSTGEENGGEKQQQQEKKTKSDEGGGGGEKKEEKKDTSSASSASGSRKRKGGPGEGSGSGDVGTGNTTAANKRSKLPKKASVSLGEEKK